MGPRSQALSAAFASRDVDVLLELLDEGVIWRGVAEDEDDVPLCRDRREVRDVLEHYREAGGDARPVILAEAGDSVLVAPRPEPAADLPLFQVYTFRGPRVALIQDYRDRSAAFAAIGR